MYHPSLKIKSNFYEQSGYFIVSEQSQSTIQKINIKFNFCYQPKSIVGLKMHAKEQIYILPSMRLERMKDAHTKNESEKHGIEGLENIPLL